MRMTPCESQPYDPSAVPEWARESIAQIAREHPENLAHWLAQVAEIETAKQHAAEHPPVLPAPPEDPRDFLHLCAIEAWRAMASGQPAPGLDPAALEHEIYEAFGGNSPVDRLCDDWLKTARERGITVDDEHGEILPDVLHIITRTITAAFWSGLTTGHFTITRRRYSIPRQFLPYFEAVAAGSRGGGGGQ
jgi:hypothetical protein